MTLTTLLHLVPKLALSGAILPFPSVSLWHTRHHLLRTQKHSMTSHKTWILSRNLHFICFKPLFFTLGCKQNQFCFPSINKMCSVRWTDIWWVFDCASSMMCREKRPTRCYTLVYWTYNLLNMFQALLCPSSGARDYTGGYSMWHITLCLKLAVWSDVGL